MQMDITPITLCAKAYLCGGSNDVAKNETMNRLTTPKKICK
jgi:hypothetical protein